MTGPGPSLRRLRVSRSIAGSLVFHALVAILLWRFSAPLPNPARELPSPIAIQVEASGMNPASPRGSTQPNPGPAPQAYDLRPLFARKGTLDPKPETTSPGEASGIPDGFGRELLLTESKVLRALDLLAARIGRHLEYPLILAENGVQGTATLDLYFDSNGRIDETRSRTYGDNRSVRGLLTRATRKGLVEWLLSDAGRIRPDQLRDQHFRADFVVSGVLGESNDLRQETLGHYRYERRRYINRACLGPSPGGAPMLDVVCVGMRIYGAFRGSVDQKYVTRFEALKEDLERLDQLGLAGINSLGDPKNG